MCDGEESREERRWRRKGRKREHGGVCVNGAKPGASTCSWVKGGAGVLVGRSVSQSIDQSIGQVGDKWRREESGERLLALLLTFLKFQLETKERNVLGSLFSGEGEPSPH